MPNFVTLERLAKVLGTPVRDFFDIGPEVGDNLKRSRLLVELIETARALGDPDLELALEQVQALARKRTGRRR
ncbi:MAG: hypothetical protein L0210_08890 [Rhodospirillales bacterium]|nr:hypothetical protein [Rhodospirillales bacterium]